MQTKAKFGQKENNNKPRKSLCNKNRFVLSLSLSLSLLFTVVSLGSFFFKISTVKCWATKETGNGKTKGKEQSNQSCWSMPNWRTKYVETISTNGGDNRKSSSACERSVIRCTQTTRKSVIWPVNRYSGNKKKQHKGRELQNRVLDTWMATDCRQLQLTVSACRASSEWPLKLFNTPIGLLETYFLNHKP